MEHSTSFNDSKNNLSSQRSLASVPSLNSHAHLLNLNASHTCLATLRPHKTSYTSSLTLAGKFLYLGSSESQVQSWHYSHHRPPPPATVVTAGNGAVKSIVVHSDKLFTAHQDHKIRVWKIHDQHSYTRVATLPTLSDRVSKILIPKNHVRIRRHKKCTWVHHVDAVSSLALSKDGNFLYSVSWDRTMKIWRTKDFACLESVRDAHDDAINAVAVSHDGLVYTGSADKRIRVWRKNEDDKKHKHKHMLVDTLEKHNSGINALALSGDGSVLYSGACDRSILVSEKGENGKLVVVGALRGHTRSILCLAVVSDLVFSGSEDKTVRVWRGVEKDYSCLVILEGHKSPIKSLTATVDRSDDPSEASFLVYSGSLDSDVKVWQVFVPLL
ncbi:protein JINGUBANG [Cajanus cajan]|uniref:Vegetative incompatibility protein HET-E-1 n=1 Tax=Cajanus cajan TaxID=3821 RepID=A0A151QT32_CAJCA|nr:protein JINGUBANG [Cajanus cajan]KYP33477.1 Vegetative incompatibility protein HET-E-1 [Cajanus cajan]